MSVRRMKRRDPKTGAVTERWFVDVDFELASGKRERVRKVSPVQTRRGAEEFERQIRQALLDGSYFKPAEEVKAVPTFDAFQDEFLIEAEVNNKPSTVYAKRSMLALHLTPFFGPMRLDEIGAADIEQFKALKLAERQSKKSINNMLTALRRLLNLALEWNVIEKVPKVRGFKSKVDLVPTDAFLDFDEERRFLNAAAPEWKTFLLVALKTGLRVGELLALKWEDVDLVAGHIIVRRTLWRGQEGPPKGGRDRKVDLGNTVLAALKAHRHLKGPYVFCMPNGRRLSHSRVKYVVPATCHRAGIPKRLTNHGLRHTFASHLMMRGAPMKVVQELLGHGDMTMTLRYSHLSPDVKREAVKLLDGPSAWSNGNLTATEPAD